MFIPTPMKKTHAYLYRDVGESKEQTPSRKHAPPLRDVSNVSTDMKQQQKQKASLKSSYAETNSQQLCDFLLKLKLKKSEGGDVLSVWTKRYFYVQENEKGPVLFYAKDEASEPVGWIPLRKVERIFPLGEGQTIEQTDRKIKNGFQLESKTRKFILRARNGEDRDAWIKYLSTMSGEEADDGLGAPTRDDDAWEYAEDENGNGYWYNRYTGDSQWAEAEVEAEVEATLEAATAEEETVVADAKERAEEKAEEPIIAEQLGNVEGKQAEVTDVASYQEEGTEDSSWDYAEDENGNGYWTHQE